MHDTSVEITVRYVCKHGVIGRVYIIRTPELEFAWIAIGDTQTDDTISQVVTLNTAAELRERRATTE